MVTITIQQADMDIEGVTFVIRIKEVNNNLYDVYLDAMGGLGNFGHYECRTREQAEETYNTIRDTLKAVRKVLNKE